MINLFKENYSYIQSKFGKNSETCQKIYNFNSKIFDNKENKEVIKNVLKNSKGDTLIIAPTGSGKTYSIFYSNEEVEEKTLMLVPANIQARQVENSYKANAYYGNRQEKEYNSHTTFSVYDSFITAYKQEYFKNIVLDEAQLLQDAAIYRKSAIDTIEELAPKYENRIYITATPNVLMYKHFDNVIYFEGDVNFFYNKMYVYKAKSAIDKTLIKEIERELRDGSIPFVRVNSKARIEEIKRYFEKKGYKVGFITSSEKGFAIEEDGSIVYDNSFTNSVINNEQLDTRNYDLFLCSCVLDQGINIVGTNSEKSINDVVMFFSCFDEKQFRLDSIQQFFARIRTNYKKAILVVKDRSEERKTNFKDLVCKEYNRINRRLEFLNEDKQNFNFKYDSDKELFKKQFEFKDVDGLNNNYCINCDENFNLSIDEKKFFNYIYSLFNREIYYNIENISEYFDNLEFVEIDEVKDSEFNSISRNDKKTILDIVEIAQSEEYTKEEKEEYTKEVLSNCTIKTIDTFDYLKEYNLDNSKAAEICSFKNSEIDATKDLLFSDFVKGLSKRDLQEIKNDLKNGINTSATRKIKGIDYSKKIIKDLDLIDEFKNSQLDSFSEFLVSRQYVEINNLYSKGQEKKIIGKAGKEQLAIINLKLTNSYISDDTIEEVKKVLNNDFNYYLDLKKEKDVAKIKELIRHIYNVDKDNKIRGLRKKYKNTEN